ncbi:hypothetical protein ACOSQ4_029484 [Xanthoceras sorbifolium]
MAMTMKGSAGGGMISSGAAGLVASSGVSRGLLAADFEGSVVSSELIVPAVPIGGLSYAESMSLLSLGVLGVGCDGGLCVGEGRFLVPTAGGTVPDPGSDRAAGTVFLGPSGSFSGPVSCF